MEGLKLVVDSIPYALIIAGAILTAVWIGLSLGTLRKVLAKRETNPISVGFALLFCATAITGFVMFSGKGVIAATLIISGIRIPFFLISSK